MIGTSGCIKCAGPLERAALLLLLLLFDAALARMGALALLLLLLLLLEELLLEELLLEELLEEVLLANWRGGSVCGKALAGVTTLMPAWRSLAAQAAALAAH